MTKIEKKLKLLFDAQDFFRNPQLDAVIREGCAKPLPDDELEFLFAAGDPFAGSDGKQKNERGDDNK